MSESHSKLHADLFNTGIQNRREVVGDSYVDNALRNGSSEFAYPGQQLITEYVFSPGVDDTNQRLEQMGLGKYLVATRSRSQTAQSS